MSYIQLTTSGCPQNKYAAQRALQRDGEQLTAALMVGVRRLDPSHRAAIKCAPAMHPDKCRAAVRSRIGWLVQGPWHIEGLEQRLSMLSVLRIWRNVEIIWVPFLRQSGP